MEKYFIVRVIGGLGNQMFQYAFARQLNKKGKNVKLDIKLFENYELHVGFELEKIFKNGVFEYAQFDEISKLTDTRINLFSKIRRKFIKTDKRTKYVEKIIGYNPLINKIDESKYFVGYWQSEKYFKDIRESLIEEFEFPELTNPENVDLLKKIEFENSVSVHIRRGDYMKNNIYSNICTYEYYKSSAEFINKKVKSPLYIIFSDDMDWCRTNLNFFDNAIYVDWNKKENSYRDMQLMTLCKHNIIANSSFSWWGAWLNQNPKKIVCAPNKWVNNSNVVLNDLIPNSWIKINTHNLINGE